MSGPASNLTAASSAPASPPPVVPPASAAAKIPAPELVAPTLTPYQKRKQREAEREAAAERRRQARAAKAPKPTPADDAEPAAPANDPGVPVRTAEVRLRDISMALRVIWRLVGVLVGFLGYTLDPLTAKEANEQADAWLPVVERYPTADRWVTWIALPAVIVEQLASKMHRKPAPPPPEARA